MGKNQIFYLVSQLFILFSFFLKGVRVNGYLGINIIQSFSGRLHGFIEIVVLSRHHNAILYLSKIYRVFFNEEFEISVPKSI